MLIVGFVLAGVMLFHVTAPPTGATGSSFSAVFETLRVAIRGNPASASVTSEAVFQLDSETAELRLPARVTEITVTGEDRSDVAAELRVQSNGPDVEGAERWARQVTLSGDQAGGSLTLDVGHYPQPGRQSARLTLRVPAGLQVRGEPGPRRTEIAGVAAVELREGRGEAIIRDVAGRVTINQRGGSLAVDGARELRLTARGADVRLSHIHGEAMLNLESGELAARDLAGSADVEARATRMVFERLTTLGGPLRISTRGGSVVLHDLASEARVDARDTQLDVRVARAAPIAIVNHERTVDLLLPSGGYRIDATVDEGRIDASGTIGSALQIETKAGEQRASGSINGGGPTISVRLTRGNIVLRNAIDSPDGSR